MSRPTVLCGALKRHGGTYPTVTLMGGCGQLVSGPPEDVRVVQWHQGEDSVLYHRDCLPDVTEPPIPEVIRVPRKVRA
jgi:hypothetical protein